MNSTARIPGWLAVVGLMGLAILVYANALDNGFHLDDFYRVVENPGIERFHPPWVYFVDLHTMSTLPRIADFRPLLPLTLAFNYWLAGHDLVVYHLTNALTLLLTSLLVFRLFESLLVRFSTIGSGPARAISLLSAALVLVHPVSALTVNYISARDLGLAVLFFFASFSLYVRMRSRGDTYLRWGGVLVLYLLSLLSKMNFAGAFAIVFLFESLLMQQSVLVAARRAAPFLAVVIGYQGMYHYAYYHSHGTSVSGMILGEAVERGGAYLLTQIKLHVFHYGTNFVYPLGISELPRIEIERSLWDLQVFTALALIALVLVYAVKQRRKCPVVSFSIAAYCIVLSVTSSVLPVLDLARDYRPFPGSPFLFLVSCLLLYRVVQGRLFAVGSCLLVAYFGLCSAFFINRIYQTELTLWEHSVRQGTTGVGHVNYARALVDVGLDGPPVRASLERALELEPDNQYALVNLHLLELRSGDREAALRGLARLGAVSGTAEIAFWVAEGFASADRRVDATVHYERALELSASPLGKYLYGAAVNRGRLGNFESGLVLLRRLHETVGAYGDSEFVEAFFLQRLGDNAGAVSRYSAFVQREPTHTQARFNLGYAHWANFEWAKARQEFEVVLELDPRYNEARFYEANCLEHEGRIASARERYSAYIQGGLTHPELLAQAERFVTAHPLASESGATN